MVSFDDLVPEVTQPAHKAVSFDDLVPEVTQPAHKAVSFDDLVPEDTQSGIDTFKTAIQAGPKPKVDFDSLVPENPMPTDRGQDLSTNPFHKLKPEPQQDFTGAEALFPSNLTPAKPTTTADMFPGSKWWRNQQKKSQQDKVATDASVIKHLPVAKQQPEDTDPWKMAETKADATLSNQVRDSGFQEIDKSNEGKTHKTLRTVLGGATTGIADIGISVAQAPNVAMAMAGLVADNMNAAINKATGKEVFKGNYYNEAEAKEQYAANPLANWMEQRKNEYGNIQDEFKDNAWQRTAYGIGAMMPIIMASVFDPAAAEAIPYIFGGETVTEKAIEGANQGAAEGGSDLAEKDARMAGALAEGAVNSFFMSMSQLPIPSALKTAFNAKLAQVTERLVAEATEKVGAEGATEEIKKTAFQVTRSWLTTITDSVVGNAMKGGLKQFALSDAPRVLTNDLVDKASGINPNITWDDMKKHMVDILPQSMAMGAPFGVAHGAEVRNEKLAKAAEGDPTKTVLSPTKIALNDAQTKYSEAVVKSKIADHELEMAESALKRKEVDRENLPEDYKQARDYFGTALQKQMAAKSDFEAATTIKQKADADNILYDMHTIAEPEGGIFKNSKAFSPNTEFKFTTNEEVEERPGEFLVHPSMTHEGTQEEMGKLVAKTTPIPAEQANDFISSLDNKNTQAKLMADNPIEYLYSLSKVNDGMEALKKDMGVHLSDTWLKKQNISRTDFENLSYAVDKKGFDEYVKNRMKDQAESIEEYQHRIGCP